MSFFVVFSSDLTHEQQIKLAYWIRILSENVNPALLFVDEEEIKNKEHKQKFSKEIEEKIYTLTNKSQSVQDIKVAELIPTQQKTKEQDYRKRYIQNQINKIYRKHNKVYFNRTKRK